MTRKRKTSSKSAGPRPQIARKKEPEVVYVTRAKDEKISLDTLPRPAWDIVCGYLAGRHNYETLLNLRKVNKACKNSVDEHFKVKKNILQIDSIFLGEMQEFARSSIDIEIRVRIDTLPLNPHFLVLKELAKSITCGKEFVVVTVHVKHRKYVNLAIGNSVRCLTVSNARSADELQFINTKLFPKTKFEEFKVQLDSLQPLNKKVGDSLLSTIKCHDVQSFKLETPRHYEISGLGHEVMLTDRKAFFEQIVLLTNNGTIFSYNNLLFGLDSDSWNEIKNDMERRPGPSRKYCRYNKDISFSWSTW